MPKSAPPVLPSHLSYKSALVLLPPGAVHQPIEHIREKHDRNFRRWPAHINLLYPFLAQPSRAKECIRYRIRQALNEAKPFEAQFTNSSYFHHSRGSATVYLEPMKPQCATAIIKVQALLQAEFTECDADKRAFTPHLSVGQAGGDAAAETLIEEVDERMIRMCGSGSEAKSWSLDWVADRVYVLERHGFDGRFQIVDEITLGRPQH